MILADLQGLCAIFAMLAALAWMISAMMATPEHIRPELLRLIVRISPHMNIWNAIAAILAAGAAFFQGVSFLLQSLFGLY